MSAPCRCCAGSPEGDTAPITIYVNPTEDYDARYMAVANEYPHCTGYGKTADSAHANLVADINCCERLAALRNGRPFYPEMTI